jgi:hypothetical protein
MLSQLFPKQIDNNYQGRKLALWLFVPIVLVKLLMGLNVAGLNPWLSNRDVLTTADGIPLESFGAEAASTVLFLFACWGLALLVLSLLGTVVMVRYRAMIPLMFLLLSIEHIGRKGLSLSIPIVRAAGSPGSLFNWGLTAAPVQPGVPRHRAGAAAGRLSVRPGCLGVEPPRVRALERQVRSRRRGPWRRTTERPDRR